MKLKAILLTIGILGISEASHAQMGTPTSFIFNGVTQVKGALKMKIKGMSDEDWQKSGVATITWYTKHTPLFTTAFLNMSGDYQVPYFSAGTSCDRKKQYKCTTTVRFKLNGDFRNGSVSHFTLNLYNTLDGTHTYVPVTLE